MEDNFDIDKIIQEREIYGKLHKSILELHKFQDVWFDTIKKKAAVLHNLIITCDPSYIFKFYKLLMGSIVRKGPRRKSYSSHLQNAINAVSYLLSKKTDKQGIVIERNTLASLNEYKGYLERLYKNLEQQRSFVNHISANYLKEKVISKDSLRSLRDLVFEEYRLIRIEREFQGLFEKADGAIKEFTEENMKLRLFLFSLWDIPPEKRGIEYLKFLRKCTPEEKKTIISLRKSIRYNRKKILDALTEAVFATADAFPYFKGLIVYGSFSRAVDFPHDIDIFPITVNGFTSQMKEFLSNHFNSLIDINLEVNIDLSLKPDPNILSTWQEDKIFEKGGKSAIRKYVGDLNMKWWNFIGDNTVKEIVKFRS